MKSDRQHKIQENEQYKRGTRFFNSLSPQQMKILGFIAQGYRNEKIADETGLSVVTIRNTINGIFRKLKPSDEEHPRITAVLMCQMALVVELWERT